MIFDFKLTFPKWLARVFGAPKTRKNRGANQRSRTNTRPLMNIVRNMYGPKTKKNGLKTNRNATKRNGTNRNGTNRNGTNENGGTNNDPGILVNNDSAKRGNNLYNKIYAKTSGQLFLNAYEKRQRNAEQKKTSGQRFLNAYEKRQRNAEQRKRNALRSADRPQ